MEIATSSGDKHILANVLGAASFVELYVNKDYAKAADLREEASELYKEYGNRWSYGMMMYIFGNVLTLQKQFGKAREKYQVAMQAMREIKSTRRHHHDQE